MAQLCNFFSRRTIAVLQLNRIPRISIIGKIGVLAIVYYFFQAILWGIEWTGSQMVLQQICNFSPRKVTVMSRGIARHTQATVSRLVQLPPLDLRATVMCGEAESCRSWDWKQTLSCGIMSHKVVVSSPQHPWTSEKYMSVTFDFKIYIPCVLKSKYGDVEASEAES